MLNSYIKLYYSVGISNLAVEISNSYLFCRNI